MKKIKIAGFLTAGILLCLLITGAAAAEPVSVDSDSALRANISAGHSVKLTADIVLQEVTPKSSIGFPFYSQTGNVTTLIINNTTVPLTIDLNGHSISSDPESNLENRGSLFYIAPGTNLTVTDSRSGGTLNCSVGFSGHDDMEGALPGAKRYYGGAIYADGTLILENITVTSSISEGTAGWDVLVSGGGIYINTTGNMTMQSGTVCNIFGKESSGVFGYGIYNAGNFTLNDGLITNNGFNDTDNPHRDVSYSEGNGGGVYNSHSGTLVMNGGNISLNAAECGGGVCNFGTFHMNGGIIYGNGDIQVVLHPESRPGLLGTVQRDYYTIGIEGEGDTGGGVYNNATFIMIGGSIENNTCGVYSDGTFLLSSNAKILNNSLYGVYNVHIFTMTGGEIRGDGAVADPENSTTIGWGVKNAGTFTMDGGSIQNNGNGGIINGVLANQSEITHENISIIYNGIAYLNNGIITDNIGYGIYNDYGTVTLNSGMNIADTAGCGVWNNATFIMKDGSKITGSNTTAEGAGVTNYGTFIMEGGEISGNIMPLSAATTTEAVSMAAAGVYNDIAPESAGGTGGQFIMSGGTIINNYVTIAPATAGGVTTRIESGAYNNATFILGGTANVKGTLYINTDAVISVNSTGFTTDITNAGAKSIVPVQQIENITLVTNLSGTPIHPYKDYFGLMTGISATLVENISKPTDLILHVVPILIGTPEERTAYSSTHPDKYGCLYEGYNLVSGGLAANRGIYGNVFLMVSNISDTFAVNTLSDFVLDINKRVLKSSSPGTSIITVNGGTLTIADGDASLVSDTNPASHRVDTTNIPWVLNEEAASGYETVSTGIITGGNAGNGGAIRIQSGSVSMTNGTILGNTAQYGGAVYLAAPATSAGQAEAGECGTFEMTGGNISGNKADEAGGAVYIAAGTATISAPVAFTYNQAGAMGGAVYINSATFTPPQEAGAPAPEAEPIPGTFEMTGGFLLGNKAGQGGAVYITMPSSLASAESSSVFTFAEGTITGNEAYEGGGIYVSSGEINLNGNATVTQNSADSTAGGIYANSGTVAVSGNPTVARNSGDPAPNTYLASHQILNLAGNFTGKFYLEHDESTAPEGIFGNATAGDLTGAENFISDDGMYCGTIMESATMSAENETLYYLKWIENPPKTVIVYTYEELKSNLTFANRYIIIGCDIQMENPEQVTRTNITIDLNGYNITAAINKSVFAIKEEGDLTLCDTSANQNGAIVGNGIISGFGWEGGAGIYNEGKFVMDGGIITGFNGAFISGGILNYGTFIMNNGSIVSNYARVVSSGLTNTGIFIMHGGTFSDNTGETCKGIYIENEGTFELNGTVTFDGDEVHLANIYTDSETPFAYINVTGDLTVNGIIALYLDDCGIGASAVQFIDESRAQTYAPYFNLSPSQATSNKTLKLTDTWLSVATVIIADTNGTAELSAEDGMIISYQIDPVYIESINTLVPGSQIELTGPGTTSPADIQPTDGYILNELYSMVNISATPKENETANLTISLTVQPGDSIDSLFIKRKTASGWEDLKVLNRVCVSGSTWLISVEVEEFGLFAMVSQIKEEEEPTVIPTESNRPSHHRSSGSSQFLTETVSEENIPEEEPSVKPTANDDIREPSSSQDTAQSTPAPILGIIAGIAAILGTGRKLRRK